MRIDGAMNHIERGKREGARSAAADRVKRMDRHEMREDAVRVRGDGEGLRTVGAVGGSP